MKYCVATFHSVFEALNFEKVLKAEGMNLQLIPVPREISSSCGVAAKFTPDSHDKILALAAAKNLEVDNVYKMEEKPKKKGLLNLFK